MKKLILAAIVATAAASPALADIKFDGYADLRLIVPSHEDDSWLEGGLAKSRYADADGDDVELTLSEIVGEVTAQLTPDLLGFASARFDFHQENPVDLVEAYLRYRPVSTNAFRWSIKAGAFFPEISLENDEVGWAASWTLTPSAINTWVGEEFRTLGADAKIELRGSVDTFEVNAAVFGWNDPAGILIDVRGWALNDRPTGLLDEVRLPDAFASDYLGLPYAFAPMFKEVDGRAGWYVRAAWEREGWGLIEAMRYDNNANPSARDDVRAWRTAFWSVGAKTDIAGIQFIAQGMAGETEVAPSATFNRVVDFYSAFLLAGWEQGDWRLAARAELFGTDATNSNTGVERNNPEFGEYGHAFTVAGSWLPKDWLRLTAELLWIESYRPMREEEDLDITITETQFQLSGRVYF